MKFLFFRSTWGMDTPSLGDALLKIKQGGFDGVELGVPDTEAACLEAKRRCDDLGLLVVVQQWTTGHDGREHSASFEAQYRRALLLNPVRVNSHTGKDHYSLEQNLEVFDRATALENQEGVPVVHETHRGRALFSTTSSRAILSARPGIRLAADFSHWCCVHESLLEDQAEFMRTAVAHSDYIHARVGFSQGPQITDPRAPHWESPMAAHLSWWKQIAAQRAAGGATEMHLCPEFGPAPYMTLLPRTQQPIADLWEVNCFMRDWLRASL